MKGRMWLLVADGNNCEGLLSCSTSPMHNEIWEYCESTTKVQA